MAKIRSVKFNFIMNSILTASSMIFPLITFPYVSRILLPVGTGKVSFATSVVFYFSMIAMMGVPTYGIRACAKVRDDKEQLTRTVQEILVINTVMSVFSYLALYGAIYTVPRLQQDKALFIVVSLTIFFNVIGVEWLYKGLEQYSYITARSIISKFIALIAMFLLVREQKDYVIYGGITTLAGVGSNVFNFINLRKYVYMHPVGGYNFKKHFRPIIIFFAMSVATTIYTNLDNVMLGFMQNDEQVGYYNAAVKVKSILMSFVTSLGTVLLPRVSYYIELGMMDEFTNITKKALNFVILIACPVTAYFVLFARQGILFLSGEAYTGSIVPMQIIMPTVLLIGLTNIMGIQILVPLGREKTVLYSEIAGALVNLVLNALLIPQFSSSGAALGTLAAEFVVLAVQFAALKKIVAPIFKQVHYINILISLAAASVLSIWTKGLSTNNFIILVISASIFFIVYGILLIAFREPLVTELGGGIVKKYLKRK